LTHFTITEVSRPPEYATTTFIILLLVFETVFPFFLYYIYKIPPIPQLSKYFFAHLACTAPKKSYIIAERMICMDFFDDLTAAIAADAAKRGIRVTPEEWQKFMGRISRPAEAAPAPRQEFTPPVVSARPVEPVRPAPQPMEPAANIPATLPAEAPPAFRIPQTNEIPGDWDGLRNMAMNCRNCALCGSRQNVVFGEGAPNARLMFIGEGPGADEDASVDESQ
jgi:hypothetical protein